MKIFLSVGWYLIPAPGGSEPNRGYESTNGRGSHSATTLGHCWHSKYTHTTFWACRGGVKVVVTCRKVRGQEVPLCSMVLELGHLLTVSTCSHPHISSLF
jgi:hypothetical protein